MKKLLLIPLFIIVLGCPVFWIYQNTKPVSDQASIKDFLILKGAASSVIGDNLEEQDLIRNSLAFKLYLYASGRQKSIVAGEYSLSSGLNLFEIVDQLIKGPKEIWVTIPEGLRREEIGQKFATVLNKDQSFIDEFMFVSSGKEGYLFPDTYLFAKEVSAAKVVDKMLSTFTKKAGDVSYDQLVMASLIERESKTDTERPVVAGILYKRIEIGMPLQVDATVQYVIGKSGNYWPEILLEDRKIKSSYNTYYVTGLPPAPIANSGLSSINAAINPQKSDYFYYLHDGEGTIHYAKTLEEHNVNIRKYLGS